MEPEDDSHLSDVNVILKMKSVLNIFHQKIATGKEAIYNLLISWLGLIPGLQHDAKSK